MDSSIVLVGSAKRLFDAICRRLTGSGQPNYRTDLNLARIVVWDFLGRYVSPNSRKPVSQFVLVAVFGGHHRNALSAETCPVCSDSLNQIETGAEENPQSLRTESSLNRSHFKALGDGTWSIWKQAVLRGAGFPIDLIRSVAIPALATTADRALEQNGNQPVSGPGKSAFDSFFAMFDRQVQDSSSQLAISVARPDFREAIIWQNAAIVATCLDKFDSSEPRNNRLRKREAVLASYLQRYTTKNESIGFFGPVGWAEWGATGRTTVVTGHGLMDRRTVYFENWAIDVLRELFSGQPEIRAQLKPRLNPSCYFDGHAVHRALGPVLDLTAAQSRTMALVMRGATVHELSTMDPDPAGAVDALEFLEGADVVRVDLGGPIAAFPEKNLSEQLAPLTGAESSLARTHLKRLTELRDTVGRAAGDPESVFEALLALNSEFESITGQASSRLHGKTYAGRSLVYEDTTRSASVVLGTNLLEEFTRPMELILQSGRWLTGEISRLYNERFVELWERRTTRTGAEEVSLTALLALASRDFYTSDGLPPLARQAANTLTAKWSHLLGTAESRAEVVLDPADLADKVREAFATTEARWAGALHHSPDLMIAATDTDAIDRGDYLLILGELHLAFNTVESRALVEQHPEPDQLLAMSEEAISRQRYVPAAPREWGSTTSRTSPPSALVSSKTQYWSVGPDDDSHLPGRSIPASGLVVRMEGGVLYVHQRNGDRVSRLTDFLGEYLSGVAVNCFRLLPKARHTPRVRIGKLVVEREAWQFRAAECNWAHNLSEPIRYLHMRAWVKKHKLPTRAFYKIPGETKPSYVDFTSPVLTNVLATHIRKLGLDTVISLSEMLPDLSECWLVDDEGNRYTSEIRTVVAELESQ